MYHTVGVFSGEGPPVPIPNTEVKLTCAEDTCLATGWKNRSTPTQSPGERSPGLFLSGQAGGDDVDFVELCQIGK